MRPKKTPLRMCAGCGEMKPKKELARVVRAPQKEDESGSPLPPEISLDLTGKKPGRGAYLCLDAQCLKQARKSRRLERAFSCKIPEEVYQRLEEEIAQAERAAQEAQQPAGPLDEKGQPIIVIEEPEEPLPRRKGAAMDKLLSLLGLARRAGKIEPGFDAAVSAARGHKAALLLAARDISEKTLKNLRYEGDRAGVPTLRGDFGMEELGRACGMRAGVLAITDKGFAKAVKELAEAVTEEKEEHAHDD